jgi:WhiB family redox-sensing transcriptional regulator
MRTWKDRAACRDAEAEDVDFFSDNKGKSGAREVEKAKAVCAGCTVRDECLEAGLAEQFGVWGGLIPHERKQLRRLRAQEPEAA